MSEDKEPKVICAWCTVFIKGDPSSNEIRQAMCDECFKRIFQRERES